MAADGTGVGVGVGSGRVTTVLWAGRCVEGFASDRCRQVAYCLPKFGVKWPGVSEGHG
jgi:hypothetical protein